jgi:sugar lactone lactonase YvrE
MKSRSATLSVDCRNQLGEMPIWWAERNAVLWVDIVRPGQIFRWEVTTGQLDSFAFDHLLTGIDLAETGELLVRSATELLLFNPDSREARRLWSVPTRSRNIRFNDGHCDRSGRFWVGTMANNIAADGSPLPITEFIGDIWVVGSDHARVLDTGFGCPNAICWSPHGDTFYIADSCDGWLYAYRAGSDSTIHERRRFCQLSGLGIPDGTAVDEEGFIWNARWGAGVIARISPAGSLDQVVQLPVSQPTACCFGGPDMRTLYITSARFALSVEQLTREPLAGSLFSIRTDVPGLTLPRFAVPLAAIPTH